MSQYNGMYIRHGIDLWAVDDGYKVKMRDMAHVYESPLRRVAQVSDEEFASIPERRDPPTLELLPEPEGEE